MTVVAEAFFFFKQAMVIPRLRTQEAKAVLFVIKVIKKTISLSKISRSHYASILYGAMAKDTPGSVQKILYGT